MSIQEKILLFISELTEFKYSHPTIFGKWIKYISDHNSNNTPNVKLIEGYKMLYALRSGVVDLSSKNYNRALLYKMSIF